jgi:hypothetical protein
MIDRIRDFVGEDALIMDGFDDAIIGVAERCGQPALVAYSRNRCIEILEGQGMDHEEANEFFDFNCAGAWMGPGTPIIIDERIAE